MEILQKQYYVFSSLIANGGKMKTLAQTIREAGYSESYARNPQKIKKTKAWKEYIAKLSNNDEDLVRSLNVLLNAKKITNKTFPIGFTEEDAIEIFKDTEYQLLSLKPYKNGVLVTYLEPDYSIRHKALDMIYKLRGLY